MIKVLLITNFPAPYFVDYAIELSKYCHVKVFFESSGANHREKSWFKKVEGNNIEYVFVKERYSKNKLPSFKMLKLLKREQYDRLIICNPASPTGILLLLYCRRKKIPFLLQSEGGFQGKGNGFKERLKKFSMEKALGFLSGMNSNNDYFLKYGATNKTLLHYPFSSLRQDEIEKKVISKNNKDRLKKQLGIKEDIIVLYVGRFIKIKGIDVLIESLYDLPDNAGIYFIGGELNEEMNSLIEKNNVKNIHTIKFLSKQQLKEYYLASDIFIMMSQGDTWGLVINEAMSNGLPVITTTSCVAGNELIENGINGYLVEKKDYKSANYFVRKLISDESLRKAMSSNNISKIQKYSIDNMALTIFNHISKFKY